MKPMPGCPNCGETTCSCPRPKKESTGTYLFLLTLVIVNLLCGCAMNSHSFKETATDGTIRELTIRTYSTWPATTELGKQRTSMGKTWSVGTSGLSEDGGSTNIAEAFKALADLVRAVKTP